jgi:hypothetical protein
MVLARLENPFAAAFKMSEGQSAFVVDWMSGIALFSFILGTTLIPAFGDQSVGMSVALVLWPSLVFVTFWSYTGGGGLRFSGPLTRGLMVPFYSAMGGATIMCAGFLFTRFVHGTAVWWDPINPVVCGLWFLYLGLHKGPVRKGELY